MYSSAGDPLEAVLILSGLVVLYIGLLYVGGMIFMGRTNQRLDKIIELLSKE